MGTALPKDDLQLQDAFKSIIAIDTLSPHIMDLAKLIHNGELDKESIEKVLKAHKIRKIERIKKGILDLLIAYINLILKDHIITDAEKKNIELLKKYFKIKEGDFYKYRRDAVAECLTRQFELIYSDNVIDKNEALHNVGLQDLFDLSYDQIEEFKEKEVLNALERGANIIDLDTTKYPKDTSNND